MVLAIGGAPAFSYSERNGEKESNNPVLIIVFEYFLWKIIVDIFDNKDTDDVIAWTGRQINFQKK